MNAKKALELSTKSVTIDITGLMNLVFERIGVAAKQGERLIRNPLSGIRQPISGPQKTAVYAKLKELGYKVEHVSEDRPHGDDYTEVSW